MTDPILLELGPFTIHWYGVTAALALVAGFFYVRWLAKKRTLAAPVENIVVWSVVWGMIGARLYHVLNEVPFYLTHPLLIPAIWRGGLAIHGGLIAGALTLLYYSRKLKIPYLKLTDILAPCLLLALAIARWGNFFNQELFGKPTTLPWGIFIEPLRRPEMFAQFTHFHPTFLYESLWNFVAVCAITVCIKKGIPQKTGILTALSLLIFGLGRLFVEFLRIDDVPIIWGVRLPLLVSVLVILIGFSLLISVRKLTKDKKSVNM